MPYSLLLPHTAVIWHTSHSISSTLTWFVFDRRSHILKTLLICRHTTMAARPPSRFFFNTQWFARGTTLSPVAKTIVDFHLIVTAPQIFGCTLGTAWAHHHARPSSNVIQVHCQWYQDNRHHDDFQKAPNHRSFWPPSIDSESLHPRTTLLVCRNDGMYLFPLELLDKILLTLLFQMQVITSINNARSMAPNGTSTCPINATTKFFWARLPKERFQQLRPSLFSSLLATTMMPTSAAHCWQQPHRLSQYC